jgi:cytochrome d ubiquinol oxidase subunit I
VVALEAGWIVTEVGRQPWTVVGVLLTRDAVTTTGDVWLFFTATLVLYTVVGAGTFYVLRLLRRRWRDGDTTDAEVPYGPSPAREPVGRTEAGR